jgi:hypothetical protein
MREKTFPASTTIMTESTKFEKSIIFAENATVNMFFIRNTSHAPPQASTALMLIHHPCQVTHKENSNPEFMPSKILNTSKYTQRPKPEVAVLIP